MRRRHLLLAAACAALLGLAGCGERGSGPGAIRQTGAPGHVTAGGKTSGEVIAASPSAPAADATAGTPGIPQGAGGNTGGAAPGATPMQQATPAPSPPMPIDSEKAGSAPPSADVKTGDQKAPPGVGAQAPPGVRH